jgi:hypothetical protein
MALYGFMSFAIYASKEGNVRPCANIEPFVIFLLSKESYAKGSLLALR